ncbi:hypothetical protein [Fibrella aestuarina]|uniref:hypothetical protein n=1 Tax=Fibrella aestuarina TaxID=651143 RepID=UPI0011D1FB0B|nr:hypothetical protein [Fibrella aestuarina]
MLSGCKQEAMPLDPRQQILGKWETFYVGNGEYRPPIANPTGYQEFLPDSVLLEYTYADKTTYRRKYWIDSLLHMGSMREDGVWIMFDYDLQFNKDTMRLERKNIFSIFGVSKHKRIN